MLALFVVLILWVSRASLAAAPAADSVLVSSTTPREPLVSLNAAQAGSFSQATDALASQGHVAIIAEGSPLTPHLEPKDTPDLTTAAPLPQQVAKLAAAYDYDAQKQGGVFILTKRYTDPKDLPCVSLEECRQAFDDIRTLLDRLSPHFDERSADNTERGAFVNFVRSLTPAQTQALQNKTLRYRDLGPEQQGMVQKFILNTLVQMPMNRLKDTLEILDYAPLSVLTGQDGDYYALQIQAPREDDNTSLYFRHLGYSGRDSNSVQTAASMWLPKPATPSTPTPPKEDTLKDVMGRLAHTGPPPVVDAALADKPVSVAGLSAASPQDVLRALKEMYGLRIGVSDAGGPKLERPILTADDSLQDLPRNVWGLLPLPMLRALHQGDMPASERHPDETVMFKRLRQQDQFESQLRASGAAMSEEAQHQVLLALQPQFRSHGLSTHVPVKTLDKATRRALAVGLCIGGARILYDRFLEQPTQNCLDCLQDMDDIIVYTVPSEASMIYGQLVPSLYFTGTDPYTKMQVSLGGGGFSLALDKQKK